MTIEAVLFDIDGTLVDSNEQLGVRFPRGEPSSGTRRHTGLHRQGGDLLVPELLPDSILRDFDLSPLSQ